MFDTELLPGIQPSASLVDVDPNAHLFSLNDPGSGSLNAGKVVQQSTSNGVNTYYTNDDLIVQPNGQEFWYDLGTGMPVGSVTTTATPLPMQTATGQYVAEYYNNNSLSGNPTFTRTESSINNDWGAGGPGQGIGNDNFSVRWTGSFNFDSGHYLFRASMDDGMRMWVDDNLVIDTWSGRNAVDYSAHQFLSSGEHKVKVEYREDTDLAIAQVRWENLSIDTTVANDDNVVAARDSNGQLRIFAIGADQDVWQWRESDNNMTWWHKMGLSATELDVTHAADGSLRVFGIGTDDNVWQWRESDNNMTWWHKMGLSSTEVVVSHAADGSLRVFGIGTDD
ncbi:MAG: hypothetical protein KME19_00005, partial [Microcoleus vaginatus WJT46-NPBG5]|nr:hypothetical protein [Microcoleus vaginatus WJT46-NPBG5]